MVEVARLVVDVDTTQLAKGEAALESFAREGKRAEAATDSLGKTAGRGAKGAAGLATATRSAGKASGVFGRQVQNASFQVGDFAVQMAGGQKASLALAQQLPQLLGGFGVLGALIGAAVAIGGALVPVFMNMFDAATTLDDAMENLDASAKDVNAVMKILTTTAEDLADKYGLAATRIRQFALAEAEIVASQAARRMADSVDILGDLIGKYELAAVEGRNFQASQEANRSALGKLYKDFGLTGAAAEEFSDALSRAGSAEGVGAQEVELANVLRLLEQNNIELDSIPEALQEAIREMILLGRETAETQRLTELLAAEAAGVTIGNGTLLDFNNLLPPKELDKARDAAGPKDRTAETFARELEALQDSLRTKDQVVEDWYNDSQATLANRRAMEILGEEGHRAALLSVEQEYQERMKALADAAAAARLQSVAGAFGDMASLMQSSNKKLFAIGKASAIAEAVVNGYSAAVKAWDKGMDIGGPAVAAAFTAASLARTGSLISSINSTSVGGGAGSTGSGGAAAPPAAANTSPRVALTLVGDDNSTFTGKQVRSLINAINEETENGAIVRLA